MHPGTRDRGVGAGGVMVKGTRLACFSCEFLPQIKFVVPADSSPDAFPVMVGMFYQ